MCYDETINYYDSRTTIVVIELEVRILISSDVIRGYNDTIILFLLMDQPSYGYQVSKMIRELSEEKYIIKGDDAVFCFLPDWKRMGMWNPLQEEENPAANRGPITG